MEITVILLGIIAAAEVSRLYLTYKKADKKSHFAQKMAGVQKMKWDLEFKIFKTREVREDVRQAYTNECARIEAMKTEIKNWPKDSKEEKHSQGEKARREDEVVRAEANRDRYEAQMKQLDVEIEGSKRTNEYPDGVNGIMQDIDGLNELEQMLKEWIKQQ
jgi:hypothetical protein